jgi:hypothetical protein
LAIAAAAVLWIRCLTELAIVIHFHLQQNPEGPGTTAARDFMYGLCTSVFLVLIAFVADDPSCQERRDPVKQLIEEDVRRHVKNAVDDAVEGGEAAPVLSDVFRDIKEGPALALSEETKTRLEGKSPDAMVTQYVAKLEKRYGALRPVDRSREY